MSNGGFGGVHQKLLEALARRSVIAGVAARARCRSGVDGRRGVGSSDGTSESRFRWLVHFRLAIDSRATAGAARFGFDVIEPTKYSAASSRASCSSSRPQRCCSSLKFAGISISSRMISRCESFR